jgi:HEAT repeat protein
VVALGKIGPRAKAAVPALLEMLKAEDEDARLKAAVALIRISPRHKPQAVVQLRKLLEHDREYIWTEAASALLRFSPPNEAEAIALLRLGLKEQTTCLSAAWALRENGPEAQALLPELLALWNDDEQTEVVADAVAQVLKRIDPAAAKQAGVP